MSKKELDPEKTRELFTIDPGKYQDPVDFYMPYAKQSRFRRLINWVKRLFGNDYKFTGGYSDITFHRNPPKNK